MNDLEKNGDEELSEVDQEDSQVDAADGQDEVSLSSEHASEEPPKEDAKEPTEEVIEEVAEDKKEEPGPELHKTTPDGTAMKWYVVHTYSGYENKARLTLMERIKREGVDDLFGSVLVPTEEVVEMRRGKRRTSKRKFFPGYMLVQMAMSENTWYLVKSTPKITGFVGDSTTPTPITESEVARITNQIAMGAETLKPKIIFEKGDSVRVVDGPFANFNGVVDEVESEKGKLRVLVSIFGRSTPVEMDFVQVEKT
jgi:transcriptional antiterminator NusG